MQGCDRGLHRVSLRRAGHEQGFFHQLQPFGDLAKIPQRAILLFQEHDVAGSGFAPRAPRVVQQHQRQQPLDLAAPGYQHIEQAAEPDRFARQIRTHQSVARGRDVAFGEDEIDYRQHAAQPRLECFTFGHLVGNSGETDFLFGAQQALRHCLLADEKRTRDLRRGQPADRAQRQGDLNLSSESRMATGEDQPHHVVVEGRRLISLVRA